jgi:hypothetical protein
MKQERSRFGQVSSVGYRSGQDQTRIMLITTYADLEPGLNENKTASKRIQKAENPF